MAITKLRALGSEILLRDRFNDDLRVWLAMTDVAAIANLWFVLDDRDLFTTAVLDNLRGDLTSRHDWRTNLHACAVVTRDEHRFEGESLALLHVDFFHGEGLAFRDEVLLATTCDYCVHSSIVLRRR